MSQKTNQVKIIRQNKWFRLWIDPRNFNPNDPLSFEHGFDISLSVDFDNDTLAKNNYNRYEIAPQAFSIKENIVKFKTGQTMPFKAFWSECLNKINGLISSVGINSGEIMAEQARATDAEKVLRAGIAALEKAIISKITLPSAIYSVELENRPEVVNIKVKSRETDKGQDTTVIFPFPVANGEHIGLMNPETFRTVTEHEKRLAAIEGRAERWPVRLPAMDVSQAQYQAAYEQAARVSAGTIPPDGTMLDNLTNNHLIKYYSNAPAGSSEHWIDRGEDTVGQASNDTAGIVKGDAITPGKIFVESDGSMSVNGWDSAIAEVRAAAENAAEHATFAKKDADAAAASSVAAEENAARAINAADVAASADIAARVAAENAAESEGVAKQASDTACDWATKMNGPVADDEYSAKHYATNAAASESGAKSSEKNAFDSATSAHNEAQAASDSATSAAASAAAAEESAQNTQQNEQLLQGHVEQAAASAKTAQSSAASATSSATTATNSANAATASANDAAGSASNARKSELAAGASASAADASLTAANKSQVAAANSADNAASSAASASDSADLAAGAATSAEQSAINAAGSAASAETSATAADAAKAAAQVSQQAAAGSAASAEQNAHALDVAVVNAAASAQTAERSAASAAGSAVAVDAVKQEMIDFVEQQKSEFATKGDLEELYRKAFGPQDYGSIQDPVLEAVDFGSMEVK